MQKEVYPRCALRDPARHDRMAETVDLGWNVLVDLDTEAALAALERQPPAERPEPRRRAAAADRVRDVVAAYTARL